MINAAEARKEMERRVGARTNLEQFIECHGIYAPAKHHKIIIEQLQGMLEEQETEKKNGVKGHGKYLIINTPPGMAKSTYASYLFVIWALSTRRNLDVIHCMNTATLAKSFGRKIRNALKTQEVSTLLNAKLDATNTSNTEFALSNGSGYLCNGVSGSITGRRARLGLIDDPNSTAKQALNSKRQEDIWNWFEAEFLTRLTPNYVVILILTRWSEDDLAGRLLRERPQQCKLIKFEAICEDVEKDPLGREMGEGMWQEYLGKDWFHEIRKKTLPWVWESLYQQNPKPQQGGIFQRSWFEVLSYDYSDIKKTIKQVFITSDFAVTAGGGDHTEFGVWAIDKDDNLLAIDWWFGQTDAEQWVEAMIDLIERWKPIFVAGEKGVIKRAVEGVMVRRMRERRAKCRIEWVASTAGKRARAFGLEQRAYAGKVKFLDKPWSGRVISQLASFTGEDGGADDAVDVCSMAVNLLEVLPVYNRE